MQTINTNIEFRNPHVTILDIIFTPLHFEGIIECRGALSTNFLIYFFEGQIYDDL